MLRDIENIEKACCNVFCKNGDEYLGADSVKRNYSGFGESLFYFWYKGGVVAIPIADISKIEIYEGDE